MIARTPAAGLAVGVGVPHAVGMYSSDEDLRARVLPFVRAGLDGGESVVAVLTERAEHALRAGLGGDGDAVQWRADGLCYRRLGQLLDGIEAFLAAQRSAGRRTRLLMENDIDGDGDRQVTHLRVEAAANAILATYSDPCVCLYDRRRYPEQVLDDVLRVHPLIVEPDGGFRDNTGFIEPDTYLAAHASPVSPVPAMVALDVQIAAPGEVRAVRRWIVAPDRDLGLPIERLDDLQIATHEVAANALCHGAPPVRIRIWRGERSAIARVDDQGTSGLRVRTAGYRRPELAEHGGLGLWLARHLADVVHVEAGPRGTSVELHFRYSSP
jgi:anti-sigma regulatory factor (Ser/Thr protein kinase)